MSLIDKAKGTLNNYKDNFEAYKAENISESDTRSKIIDRLFIDVLGWEEIDIIREEHGDSGYYDYKFSTANFQFIVEAKKNLQNFIFPDSAGNNFKIKTIINKGNEDVVTQIRNYLIDHSLTYGVITNGHQFIISRFVNYDGADWKENDVFIFRSVDELQEDFITFYNLLSKEAVLTNNRIKFFKEELLGQTVLEKLNPYNKDEVLVRNELSGKLVQVVSDVFEDIYDLNDKRVLEACYVENKDIMKQNSELDILFPDDPPNFDKKIEKLRNTENTREKIKNEIVRTAGSVPNPIIIIGGKGAGKTTFIKYFIEVTLSDDRKTKQVPVIYLDFKNFTFQQIRDTKSIYDEIIKNIADNYAQYNLFSFEVLKKIYEEDLDKNIKSFWSYIKNDEVEINKKTSIFLEEQVQDKINFLKKMSVYLMSEFKVRLCIVLDNADQLDDESQKEIFLLSQSINISVKCLVVLSLREGYFFQWREKPPFDAYPSIVFHITAPPYNDVLKKRIEFILSHYDFSKLRGSYEGKTVELGEEKLKNFFQTLYNTFFNEQNSDVLKFLGETSYPNTRSLLKKIQYFLLSGYTKISTYIASDFEKIPVWDFIKAVALDSKYYYKSKYSIVHNLFYPTINNKNHFTKIRLLKYLLDISKTGSKANSENFKQISEIFGKAGYAESIIKCELEELLKYNLVETTNFSSDTEAKPILDNNCYLKITLAGKYYICDLLSSTIYIDLMSQDTIIYRQDFLEEMVKLFPIAEKSHGNRDMKGRLEVMDKFLEYLEKEEENDMNRNETGVYALDFSIVGTIRSGAYSKGKEIMMRYIQRSSK